MFSVLGLIGLVQIVKGELNWTSLLIISILLLSLYYFGNFWFQRKTQEKLAQLQISEDQIPELKIITPQEGVMIFLLIAVISGVFIMQRYLPSGIELEREIAKIDAEARDISRAADFITLGSLL